MNRCQVCQAPAVNSDAALCLSCSGKADKGEIRYHGDRGWQCLEPGSVEFVQPGAKKAGDRISLPGGWYFERYNDDGVVFSLRTPAGRGFGIKGTGCGLYTETAQSFAKAMWQAADVHVFECQECSGIGHTGIDGDKVYDCPACLGEGKLTPIRDTQWKLECLGSEHDHAVGEIEARNADLQDISAAIATTRFMDPPDGGYVTLATQVRRMRQALDEAEASAKFKPLKWRHVDVEWFEAHSIIGTYEVCGQHWSFAPTLKKAGGEMDSLSAAKQAAQLHRNKFASSGCGTAPPAWRDIASAPEDEPVIVATTGGWVGEAIRLGNEWSWSPGNVFHSDIVPLKWQPLPPHPEPASPGAAKFDVSAPGDADPPRPNQPQVTE